MDKIGEKISFIAFFFTIMNISSSPHPIALILCYVVHEIGHIFFAKVNGINMRKIKVGSFRLSLSYDCTNISYKKELLVCVGGIAFNLAFAFLSNVMLGKKSEAFAFFSMYNLSLALMNIYPISTLDGGGILRCIFMLIFDFETAERLSRAVSFMFVFILWLLAVYLQLAFNANASLFFISVFLLIELCFSN